MLKGLALTPPVIGRIAIGKLIDKAGRPMPEKDDEFTLTTQAQGRDGWIRHPLDASLRPAPDAKLRAIPVRLLFVDPDLSLRANFTLFDRRTGRPLCVGNGETCKRATRDGLQVLPCPTPEACELAKEGSCKPYGRLNVRIGDEDELGSFIFRTTGFNSIRTLSARLRYFHAASGGLLATLPLELRLRGKSTTQSHRAPIYYVDLTLRSGATMATSLQEAKAHAQALADAGFDQTALDAAARAGFAQGAFEESVEEGAALVEEFYPQIRGDGSNGGNSAPVLPVGLSAKLSRKLEGAKTDNTPLSGDGHERP